MSLRGLPPPAGRVVFVQNRFDTVVAMGGQFMGAESGGNQEHVLIEGNVSTGGFWFCSAVNSTVRNNRMVWKDKREFDPAIYRIVTDQAIRESSLLSLRSTTTVCENIQVDNNTYVGPGFLGGVAHNLKVYDNIIVGPAGLGALVSSSDGNLYHPTDAKAQETWLAAQRAKGQDQNSKLGDPKFLSLDPASPDFLKPAPGGPGEGVGARVFDK